MLLTSFFAVETKGQNNGVLCSILASCVLQHFSLFWNSLNQGWNNLEKDLRGAIKDLQTLLPPLPLSLLLSWTWPWRRRWQVSGWRFPVWMSWAAVTIKTPVMSWTSWSLRVRTVLNRCTPTACPVAAPSKLWVFLLVRIHERLFSCFLPMITGTVSSERLWSLRSPVCLLRARTLCLSPTSTCPTWICPTGWLTGTTVCRASWVARTKSWAASKWLCLFTLTEPTTETVRFKFYLLALKNHL